MTNCIIIHGCPSNKEKSLDAATRTYDKHRIPRTKKQLESRGIHTDTPLMPAPRAPQYDAYKQVIQQFDINENTILIGHSCGCAFLVRRLGETKKRIKKLILVAPRKIPEKKSETTFYTYDIDPSIPERVEEIVMFTADDEDPDGKESLVIFHDALGGKIIDLPGRGHYCLGDMGTEQFPELIKAVMK